MPGKQPVIAYGLTLLLVFVFSIGCSRPPVEFNLSYDLSDPNKKYILDDELDEISGMTHIGDKQIAVIQDEKGVIYVYSLKSEKIRDKIKFGSDADFEGLAERNGTYYALSSDGKLHTITPGSGNKDKDVQFTRIDLPFSTGEEAEGLCHQKKNQFLITYKTASGLGGKDARGIYVYKAGRKYHAALPLFTITNKRIKQYAEQHSGIQKDLEKLIKNAGNDALFMPSGIAIHPLTGDIYVVSGVNELLIVIDSKASEIVHVHNFDKDMLAQPEGITFDNDGDMYISSEKGSGKNARILRFEMD